MGSTNHRLCCELDREKRDLVISQAITVLHPAVLRGTVKLYGVMAFYSAINSSVCSVLRNFVSGPRFLIVFVLCHCFFKPAACCLFLQPPPIQAGIPSSIL